MLNEHLILGRIHLPILLLVEEEIKLGNILGVLTIRLATARVNKKGIDSIQEYQTSP